MGERRAVALEYDPSFSVPRVVASARALMAEKLIQVAREYGVTIYEDPDLAVALGALNAGDEIPDHLYRAVAEVLAYCYTINDDFKRKIHGA